MWTNFSAFSITLTMASISWDLPLGDIGGGELWNMLIKPNWNKVKNYMQSIVSYREESVHFVLFVKFDLKWIGSIYLCTVFFWPAGWNDGILLAHIPIYAENLWNVISKARAIRYQDAKFLNLCEYQNRGMSKNIETNGMRNKNWYQTWVNDRQSMLALPM